MSKQLIDKLLEEAYLVATDRWARKKLDKARQEVTITRANFKNALIEAFSEEHQKEFPDSKIPFNTTGSTPEFNAAVEAGFAALLTHLEKPNTVAYLQSVTSQKIVFAMDRTVKAPVTNLKKGAVKSLNESLRTVGKNPLSTEQEQKIQAGLERLHTNVTVGLGRLSYVLTALQEDPVANEFFSSKQYKELVDKFGPVLLSYQITDFSKPSVGISYKGTVGIELKAKSKNFAGSEAKDWANVKPYLEEQIAKWLENANLADQKGSNSPRQQSEKYVEALLVDTLVKGIKTKKAKLVTKKPKKPKPLTKKPVTKKKKPKARKTPATVKPKVAKSKTTTSSPSIVDIIGVLNRDINRVVAKNMGSPALNYRTGEFANSVQILDVTQTRQGFPSIGYTYDKYPYQTFEPGFEQGSIQRDPRTLIQTSIREILSSRAIGRFYMRRL